MTKKYECLTDKSMFVNKLHWWLSLPYRWIKSGTPFSFAVAIWILITKKICVLRIHFDWSHVGHITLKSDNLIQNFALCFISFLYGNTYFPGYITSHFIIKFISLIGSFSSLILFLFLCLTLLITIIIQIQAVKWK